MNKPIVKGSVVKYQDGHMRVTAVFPNRGTCNLGTIFGSKVQLKGVRLNDVTEDEEAWYAAWTKSETYLSM
jgi:hypothetical protein